MAALNWLHPRARRIAGRAKRRIVRIVWGWQIISLYVYELTYAQAPTVALPDAEITIKELTESDEVELSAVAEFGFYGQSKEQLVGFLREGQRCHVAVHEGQPVCYQWRAAEEHYDPILKRSIRLGHDEEYLLGGYTTPEFRGMGIAPYLISMSSKYWMQNTSDLKAITFVRTSNRVSVRTIEKLGFIRTGRIGFIECMGIRWNFLIGRGVLPETKKRNFFSAPGWK